MNKLFLEESPDERRQRLASFLGRLAPVAAIFGLTEAWAGDAYGDRASLESAAAILLFAGVALAAVRINARGRTELASGLTSGSITVVAVVLAILQPELAPTLAIVPLIGAVLAYPYVEGRALAALLAAQVLATGAITTLGALLPRRTDLPRTFTLIFHSAATVTVVAFVAYLLWQYRNRVRARWIVATTRQERLEAAIAELTGREREARLLAMRDSVTGLANRRLFLDRLEEAMAGIDRGERQVGILFVDLDRFKAVNDRFGHAAGDELLAKVATTLQTAVRSSDTLARLGGDEFALVMPRIDSAGEPEELAKRLLRRLAEPLEGPWGSLVVEASIGLAIAPDHATTAARLMRAADAAMYRAKSAGGARYAWGRPVTASGGRISGGFRGVKSGPAA